MNSFLDRIICHLRFQKVIPHIPASSVVCDIGCGPEAVFLKSIAGLIKYGIGFDQAAEDYKDSKLEIKKFKLLNRIPLESKAVEVVTLLAVLEHLKNPQPVLNESFRILKNKGKLILTTPAPRAKPVLEFLAFKLNLIDPRQIREHKNYFSAPVLKNLLIEAGFREENIKTLYFELGFNSLTIAKK